MGIFDWFKRQERPGLEAYPAAHDVFLEAFARVVGEEGGYTADSRDPGGETKFGISKRAHPDLDIASLTIDDARAIYLRDYWLAAGLDRLPARMAIAVFDGVVNSGERAAIGWLQRALGVVDDGVVGEATLEAARAATDVSGVLMRFHGHRLKFMADLSTWPAFGRGWARRIARNLVAS